MEGKCTRWPVTMTPSSRVSTQTTGLSQSFPLSSNSLSLTAVDAARHSSMPKGTQSSGSILIYVS